MLSEKTIKEFKEIYEKESGKKITDVEAFECAHNLVNYVKLLCEIAKKEEDRMSKLIENPKGFHLEGDYSCTICGMSAAGENGWFDKFGIKCMTCQKAVNKKVIPGSVAKNKDSWYTAYDLESRFNINRHALKKAVKDGILKAREISSESGRVHYQLFLIKDNKNTLPPKKLTDSQLVKETEEGKDRYHSEPWYKFVDPHEHLKGFKIMDYLKFTREEPAK